MVIGGILLFGLIKKVNILDSFVEGALGGMKVVYKITPTMMAIVLAVGMFKASGGLELLSRLLDPLVSKVMIPKELVPLMLMRPVSGSGALTIYKDIITAHGPDSLIGRIASVMQGSTETTFYTIALYYSVTSVKKTRHTLLAASAGDLTGFIISALCVHLILS